MNGRYYEDTRRAAADIAHDVVLDGYSEGWSGTAELLAEVQAILAPMGIRYLDDMRGRWEHRALKPVAKPVNEARVELAFGAALKELVIDPDTLPDYRYEPALEAMRAVLNDPKAMKRFAAGQPVLDRPEVRQRVDFRPGE